MLKKKYVIPSVAVVKMESVTLLAGSDGEEQKINGRFDSDDTDSPSIGWGGTTKKDETYDPD